MISSAAANKTYFAFILPYKRFYLAVFRALLCALVELRLISGA